MDNLLQKTRERSSRKSLVCFHHRSLCRRDNALRLLQHSRSRLGDAATGMIRIPAVNEGLSIGLRTRCPRTSNCRGQAAIASPRTELNDLCERIKYLNQAVRFVDMGQPSISERRATWQVYRKMFAEIVCCRPPGRNPLADRATHISGDWEP